MGMKPERGILQRNGIRNRRPGFLGFVYPPLGSSRAWQTEPSKNLASFGVRDSSPGKRCDFLLWQTHRQPSDLVCSFSSFPVGHELPGFHFGYASQFSVTHPSPHFCLGSRWHMAPKTCPTNSLGDWNLAGDCAASVGGGVGGCWFFPLQGRLKLKVCLAGMNLG